MEVTFNKWLAEEHHMTIDDFWNLEDADQAQLEAKYHSEVYDES